MTSWRGLHGGPVPEADLSLLLRPTDQGLSWFTPHVFSYSTVIGWAPCIETTIHTRFKSSLWLSPLYLHVRKIKIHFCISSKTNVKQTTRTSPRRLLTNNHTNENNQQNLHEWESFVSACFKEKARMVQSSPCPPLRGTFTCRWDQGTVHLEDLCVLPCP